MTVEMDGVHANRVVLKPWKVCSILPSLFDDFVGKSTSHQRVHPNTSPNNKTYQWGKPHIWQHLPFGRTSSSGKCTNLNVLHILGLVDSFLGKFSQLCRFLWQFSLLGAKMSQKTHFCQYLPFPTTNTPGKQINLDELSITGLCG